MTGTIGVGTAMTTDQFNRRALPALRGLVSEFEPGSFVENIKRTLAHGTVLTVKQQQSLYNVIHQYRNQITDQQLKAYAAARAKGCD